MDEKICSACGGAGWVADGNEARLCDCYQNRVYAVNVVSSRVPGRYFGSRLQDFELDTIKRKKALAEADLRRAIRTAGGFSSEMHWWQGPCICGECGHTWQGAVEIPVEATSPQVPLECSECHQMTGGPA